MRLAVVVGLCCFAAAAWAGEALPGVAPQGNGGGGEVALLDRGAPPKPGLEIPVSAAEACVLRFAWDTYTSVIVVGEGVGMVKPAWVATFEKGGFIVGYRATAFRDGVGRLHIDARRARDVGPNADNWIPDSFAFGTRLVWTLDDQGHGNAGEMGEVVTAAANRAAWQADMQRVEALIEGGL